MTKFRDYLREGTINEAATNKREKMFEKICKGKNLARISELDDIRYGNTNVSWYCMIMDSDEEGVVFEQRLIWGTDGFYELLISSDSNYYNFTKASVGKFELFEDALKIMEKNILFIKNNSSANVSADIKKFS